MDKQITKMMGTAREVLSRIDVVDQLYALDQVLFTACPSDNELVVTHTLNHVAFMASLAATTQDLDKIVAIMDQVKADVLATKRAALSANPARTVH